MHDEAIMQASLGVKSGGLGLRHAVDTACPSYIASKIAARPIVARLAAGLQSLDMLPEGLERDYNNSLTSAVLDFKSTLDPSSVETVDELILKEAMFVEKLFQVADAGHALLSRVSGSGANICDVFIVLVGNEDT